MPSVQPSTEVENMSPSRAFRCHFEKVAQDCVKKRTWKGSCPITAILKKSLIVLCLPFTPCKTGLQKYISKLWSFSLAQSAFEKSSTIPGTWCLRKYMPIKTGSEYHHTASPHQSLNIGTLWSPTYIGPSQVAEILQFCRFAHSTCR